MPSAASRSLLLLHGSGGGGAEFARRLGTSLAPWELEAIDAPGGSGRWWTYPAGERSYTASAYEGAEESIAAVEKALVRGNHAGVLGFSQGAMLAAIIAARSALGEGVSASPAPSLVCSATASRVRSLPKLSPSLPRAAAPEAGGHERRCGAQAVRASSAPAARGLAAAADADAALPVRYR